MTLSGCNSCIYFLWTVLIWVGSITSCMAIRCHPLSGQMISGKVHNKTRIWFFTGFPTQASSLPSLFWEAKCQFSRAASSLFNISFARSDPVCSFCGYNVGSGQVSGTGLKFNPSRSLKNELDWFGCVKVDYSSCPKISKVLFSSFC